MQALSSNLYGGKPKNFLSDPKSPLVVDKEDYTYVNARVNDWELEQKIRLWEEQ